MGRGSTAGGRTQSEPQPRVLGQLAAGRCARGQHARHGGAPGADRDAVGRSVFVVGMADRVLVVGSGGSGRLLHPHQGQRRADLPRSATRGRADQGRVVRRRRGAEAVSARSDHGDGPALRREHHVLPGGHLLDHVSEGAGPCQHQRHPVVVADSSRGALRCDPPSRPALGPFRAAPGVFRRCDRRRQLGLLRVPDDGQRSLPGHHDRNHPRPGDPRDHVRAAAGDHGGDVPDQDAVFRCLSWLSGHCDLRRLTRADTRRLAEESPVQSPHG